MRSGLSHTLNLKPALTETPPELDLLRRGFVLLCA